MSLEDASGDLAIQVKNVYKQYGRGQRAVSVLKEINMEVPFHTTYALLGASGCGKTTLLRLCLGFIRPNKGSVQIMGNSPGARGASIPGKQVGYMPQDVGLVYELSIIETMYLFGVMFKLKFGHVRERAEFLRKLLDLPPLKRHISHMSGGEQRRVSFAVSLLQQPTLLILDEPTVGLDSVLRQSVWQHLEELTTNKQCTVIITTHYIDEARQADLVGLMRGGKLLSQSKPNDLMRAHNAVTLEEVFVKLAYKQEEQQERGSIVCSIQVDTAQSIQSTSDQRVEHTRNNYTVLDRVFPRFLWDLHFTIIVAIALKMMIKTLRSIPSLLYLLAIPTVNVLGLVYSLGGDIHEVKVFYSNEDNPTIYKDLNLTTNFINDVGTADEFDTEAVEGGFLGVSANVKDGDGPIGLYIGPDFTDSLFASYPSIDVVGNSTIRLAVDSSDTQLLTQSMLWLNREGVKLLDSFFLSSFDATYDELASPPVQLAAEVHGSVSWEYSDYIGSTALVGIVFFNTIALTAMNFVLERKEGLFERFYSAGASVADFLIAYILHASVILSVQVILLMTVTFGILGVERAGSLFLYALLIWLTCMLGSAVGLLLSSQVIDEITAQNLAQTVGGVCSFLSGCLWPVYGQPTVVRSIGMFLPITLPTSAASAIGSKGLGMGDEPVYVGFIVLMAWMIVVFILSIACFRTV